MEDTPRSPPKNVGLWVGLGCLGVLVLSCCLLTFWMQSYGWRWILRQGDETKIWASRAVLVGALEALIVPGLRELRVPTQAVERWLAAGAPTDGAPTDCLGKRG